MESDDAAAAPAPAATTQADVLPEVAEALGDLWEHVGLCGGGWRWRGGSVVGFHRGLLW